MANSATVQGFEQLQAANRQLVAAMQPSGPLGKAVIQATTVLRAGTAARAHRDTGTFAASQMVAVSGLVGTVFTASNRNPKSGVAASTYGPFEEARGGSHAAYRQTVTQDATKALTEAAAIIIQALP